MFPPGWSGDALSTESSHDKPRKAPVTVLRREAGFRAGVSALMRGRCPRCRSGRIFTALMRMPEECEVCALRFEREPGYFTGAMYISYVLALPIFVGLFLALGYLVPELGAPVALVLTVLLFLPFVPVVFRFSRIVWIHLDRTIDAGED
jgi:uncharacterized protein (DUF983 family)